MAKSKFSYDKSLKELQGIIEDLSDGDVSIDQLQLKVKKAKDLLEACQEKLRATEKEILQIVA
jgi:exodeoxyribonuclease VII small subunit